VETIRREIISCGRAYSEVDFRRLQQLENSIIISGDDAGRHGRMAQNHAQTAVPEPIHVDLAYNITYDRDAASSFGIIRQVAKPDVALRHG
jgi:hypothetical protein